MPRKSKLPSNAKDFDLGSLAQQVDRAKVAGLAPEATVHGLTPGEIERMQRKAEQAGVNIEEYRAGKRGAVSSVYGPTHKELLDPLMPKNMFLEDGAALRRTAQTYNGNGGGGLNSIGPASIASPQMPYLPEFANSSLQSVPTHRRTVNCFVAGTPVILADGTSCPIENVRIGMKVLDHTGKEQTVENAWAEEPPEQLVELELVGGRKFVCTPNHRWPVWVLPRTCNCGCGTPVKPGRCWVHSHFPKRGKNVQKLMQTRPDTAGRLPLPQGYEPLQELEAIDIRKGDFLTSPRQYDTSTSDVSPEKARLLGYYVAEGCDQRKGLGTVWSLHKKELDTLAKDIQDICSNMGVDTYTREVPGNGIQIRTKGDNRPGQKCLSSTLQKWFVENGGEYSHTKKFSREVMQWPLELQIEVLRGLFRGDGHQKWIKEIRKGKEVHSFRFEYATVSPHLATQVQLMLIRMGFNARRVTRKAFFNKKIGYNQREAFFIGLSGAPARKLADLIWGETSKSTENCAKSVHTGSMVDDDFVYSKVKSVKVLDNTENCKVYNLSISGKHSYLVDNIGVFNSYMRLFKKFDPTIGAVIEMFSLLPWSDFQLTGEGVDGEIKDTLEHMINETHLRGYLPEMVSEWLTLGEVTTTLNYDKSRGIWNHITIQNPDQVNVVYSPFIKMDPIMEYVPDAHLRELLASENPSAANVRRSLPPEVVARIRAGQNIPLSPVNSTFIARKTSPYDLRGTSIIMRLWRTLEVEDALWESLKQTSKRFANPLKVVKLGNMATNDIPTASEEKKVLEMLAALESDSQGWFVYNPMIQFEMVGQPTAGLDIRQNYDLIERIKLVALGVSKAFISGEQSYSAAAAGLTVFLQRLKAIRDLFVSEWLIPKYFLPIAVMNGWLKTDSASKLSKGRLLVKKSSSDLEDERNYIVPKLEWSKSLDSSVDKERIDAMSVLEGSLGIKISDQRKFACLGLDAEEEQEKLVKEIKRKRQLAGQDPELQAALGLATTAGGEGGGGGLGGGMGGGDVISPGIPPESMGLGEGGEGGGGGLGGGNGGAGGEGGELPAEAPGSAPGAPGAPEAPTVAPEGASLAADKGSKPKTKKVEKMDSKHWADSTVRPLQQFFKDFDVDALKDSEITPWIDALREPIVKGAIKSQDADELWIGIEQHLIDEGYPDAQINELHSLLGRGKRVAEVEDFLGRGSRLQSIFDNMPD